MPNKTVLITGASRGIGRETALAFARAGYQVAANYHQSYEQALSLCAEVRAFGGVCEAFSADVSCREAVFVMVNAVRSRFGQIDILINNAGIAQQKLFTDLTEADWSHMLRVNLDSVFHCCQAVLPEMIHRKSGCILNVSSMWGQVGASCEVSYSASKAAVIGLTKALAKEVGLSGIRVNCIAPGFIETEMNRTLSDEDRALLFEEIPLGTGGSPADVAQTALFLASSAARYLTGQVISVNGGMVV